MSTGLMTTHIAGQSMWPIRQNKHLSNKRHFIAVVKNGRTRYILNSAWNPESRYGGKCMPCLLLKLKFHICYKPQFIHRTQYWFFLNTPNIYTTRKGLHTFYFIVFSFRWFLYWHAWCWLEKGPKHVACMYSAIKMNLCCIRWSKYSLFSN